MLTRSLPTLGWVWLGVVVALLALAVPASADHAPAEPRAYGSAIEETVEPLGPAGETIVEVAVPCGENETGTAWARAEVGDAPSFLVVSADDQEAEIGPNCSDAHQLVVEVPVEASFTNQAPAFEPATAQLAVHVQKNRTDGNTTELPAASANVTATPGYFNLYNANLDVKIAEAGPDEDVPYTLIIEDHSNGDTRFEFSLAEDLPQGFQAVVPAPVVVEHDGADNRTVEVTLSVFTPFHNGWVNEVGTTKLQIDSFYAPNTSIEGDSAQVSVLTKARGFHIPGPGVVLASLSLVVAGLAARRRER